MIADRLERWPHYFTLPAWRRAFDFLQTLDAASPDGRVELDGADLFALVMTYETHADTSEAILETHRRYIDIQVALSGPERIAWYPVEMLSPLGPYDAQKDATYYAHPSRSSGDIIVNPGSFVVLYPTDGHMPQLAAPVPQVIKKAVVKLSTAMVAA